MSLKWLEGWGLYDAQTLAEALPLRWRGRMERADGLHLVPGRLGGRAVRMTATARAVDQITTPNLTPQETWTVGFAWRPLADRLDGTILKIASRDGLEQVSIRALPGQPRTLHVYRGDGVPLTTCPDAWNADEWQFLELHVTIGRNDGSVELRGNGKTFGLPFQGNTKNSPVFATACSVAFCGVAGGYDLGDLYVLDGVGTQNNGFMEDPSDCMVLSLLPVQPPVFGQWEPTSTLSLGGSSFISANKPGARNIYALAPRDKRAELGGIAGVVYLVSARRPEPGQNPQVSLLVEGRQDPVASSWKVSSGGFSLTSTCQETGFSGQPWTAEEVLGLAAGVQIDTEGTVQVGFVGAEVLTRVRERTFWSSGQGVPFSVGGDGSFLRHERQSSTEFDSTVWLRLKGAAVCLRHPDYSNVSRGYINLAGQATFQRIVNR